MSNHKIKLVLCFLLFTGYIKSVAQSNDSIALFGSLVAQAKLFMDNGQLDSARIYSNRSQKFPKDRIPDDMRIHHINNFAFLLKDKNKAISFLEEAQQFEEKKKNYKNLAHIYYSKGVNHYDSFNDREALVNYIKADSLFEKLNLRFYLAVMTKVGIVNVLMKSGYESETKKFNKALPYINEGIMLADSIKFTVGSTILLEKKGHFLELRNQLKESLKIYRLALLTSKEIGYVQRESSIYDGMGDVHFKLKNVDSAAYFYERHLALIKKTDFPMDIAEAHYNIGKFYNKVSKFQKAENNLQKAWALIQDIPNVRKEYPYNIQNNLAISYSGLMQHENALLSLNKAKELLEEVHAIRSSENVLELETRYQTEKKEQEIALLRSRNELAEQQQRSQRNILLAGILLTSLAGIFLFVLFKNRQRTNKKLREIDALKTNFFTNFSHEFRTPLTLISTPIQESLDDDNITEEKRNHFEMAQRNTKRLSSLVDQLLELSKIDSGNRNLILENTAPTQLVSSWSESFLYLAAKKKLDFKIEIETKDVKVWFDREALENITINLLGNAIKYTPEKGKVHIRASVKNNLLSLDVSNTGPGLLKSQMNTIFNRFYQTNSYSEGAGIGLSLVKELVELHKGQISVKSTPNEWTTFAIKLTTDKGAFKNATIKDSPTTAGKIITLPSISNLAAIPSGGTLDSDLPILLIVEDNADVRLLLNDAFKKDYNIMQAENGEEGIKMAIENVPDIIISDLMMPVQDGIELTKILKEDERTSHIPIILLTAKAGDENELTGINVGADDYITKPFNQKILKSKTASLISLRKKLRSRYSQEVILRPKDIAITSVDERFLEKVQKILDEKLIESNFTIEAFSKAVHMSRMQLHRKLKALTGLSASEFIKSQRLKLAVQILRSSDINISEVGYSVGFNDHAYFSKCFKETYNCTPSDFAEGKTILLKA